MCMRKSAMQLKIGSVGCMDQCTRKKRSLRLKNCRLLGGNSFGELLVDAHCTSSTEMSDHMTVIIIIKSTYQPCFKCLLARAT